MPNPKTLPPAVRAQHLREITNVFRNLLAIMQICMSHGMYIESNVVDDSHPLCQIKDSYLQFRSAYNSLSWGALQDCKARWPVRPKNHAFEHLCLDFMEVRNARHTQCMLDEDMMKIAKRIVVKTHPLVFGVRVLEQYCTAASLRWTNFRVKKKLTAPRAPRRDLVLTGVGNFPTACMDLLQLFVLRRCLLKPSSMFS